WIISSNSPLVIDDLIVETEVATVSGLWKSPIAWQVTLFMVLQSFVFYVIVSWLPDMMQDYGFSVPASGWLVPYAQFVGLPSTFLAPVLAEKFKNQQGIVLVIGALMVTGFTGL